MVTPALTSPPAEPAPWVTSSGGHMTMSDLIIAIGGHMTESDLIITIRGSMTMTDLTAIGWGGEVVT